METAGAEPCDPPTAAEAVAEGAARLASAGIETARLDAELLVCHILGWDRTKLYTYPEQRLADEEAARWRSLLERRMSREPLPYLLGEWEFYGRRFRVTPAVLIPRPETELLIDGLLLRRPWNTEHSPLVADVGTGSGCIGLTLAAESREAIIIITDVSPAALEVARFNAVRLGVEDRIEARRSAFPAGLEDREGQLDVLVSNPPYVAERDRDLLSPEVARYEPREALFSGEDGLDLIRQLLERGKTLLRSGGWIALEFGIGQSGAIHDLAERCGYRSITIEKDMAGIPRALFAQSPS
jgi:release factor glutamine methyltransferase